MYLPFESATELVARLLDAGSGRASWLLCVSDRHAETLPELFNVARTQGLELCGGVFPGLIEGVRRRDSGVIAIPFPQGSRIVAASVHQDRVEWLDQLPDSNRHSVSSMLLLIDCLSLGIARYLEEIYDFYGATDHYVGAAAGYHDLRPSPAIFTQDGFIPKGGLLVQLPVSTTSCVRHGWNRVAGPFIVTRTKKNLIQEINWEPAGSFYRKVAESLAPELKGKPVFPDLNSRFPLCLAKQSAEDVVRDPLEINSDDEIVMLSELPENSAIYLIEANRETMVAAAREAARECRSSHEVEAFFVSDCYSRALILDQDYEDELEAVAGELEKFSQAPVQGVLAMGEICGDGHSSLEFYNKTFVISAIHRVG
jgi:hypothetical protein